MLLPLLTALAVLTPLSSDVDQARLTALFAGGVETAVITSAQKKPGATVGNARRWRGDACSSGVQIALPGLPPLTYDLQWARARVDYQQGGREVVLKGAAPPTRVPVATALTFRFADERTARAAALAMNRLKTACTPQR